MSVRNKYNFFGFITLLSLLNFIIVFLSYEKLENNIAFGFHALSIYIQLPLLTLSYILLSSYFHKNHNQSLSFSLITTIPSIIIFLKYFFNELNFYDEDNLRYDTLARYFISENTFFSNEAFKIQPGYPYYLAIILSIFESQSRFTQLLNILFCFILLCMFINLLLHSKIKNSEKYFIYYLVLSSTPFLSQNILFSGAEWLAFSLGFFSVFLLNKKNYLTLGFVLGYMVLLRTNLVLINSFFVLLIYYYSRNKIFIIIYFTIVFLPFMHNYFMHDSLAFFITKEIVEVGDHTKNIFLNPLQYSYNHFLSYLAISKSYVNLNFLDNTFLISIFSLPFFFIYFLKTFCNSNVFLKFIIFAFLFLSCGVTFFHGWAYYPRFQLTNYMISLLYFLSIRNFTVFGFNPSSIQK